jgi:hypothetical protein
MSPVLWVESNGQQKSGPVSPGPLGVFSGLTLGQPLGWTLLSPVAGWQLQQQQESCEGIRTSRWFTSCQLFGSFSTAQPLI